MKCFKRAIATVLVLAMVLALMPAVFAEGGFTVDIDDANLAKGEKVVLAVKISGHDNDNPVASAKLAVEYDTENLKLTKSSSRYRDFVSSSREQSIMGITANGNAISWADAYGLYAEDGDTLFWMEFTTLDEVANGSYTITLKAHNSETMFSDANRNLIPDSSVTINAGTITVTGGVDKLNGSNTVIDGLNATYTYDDGNAIEPAFTVKYGGKTLTKDTDYTVSYENNTAVGTATVTVTGIGAYRGTTTTTFEIVKKTGAFSGKMSYSKVYGDAEFTLDAAVNSGAALSYSSDNNAVATVDAAGTVTVVGAGSAVITVSADATENYTKPADYKINVTVGKADQSLDATLSYAKTYGDDAFDLDVTGAKGTLSYSSDDTAVVSVDAGTGKVTVNGVGTAVITAAAAEVTGKYNAADIEITVTVEPKEVTVSGITVADKVYNKTTDAVITSKGTIDGKVDGDDLDINVTGTFADANAGEGKTVDLVVELIGSDVANYILADGSQKTAAATIEKETVAVPAAKTGLVYNAKEQTGVEAGADYTVTGGTATGAGNYMATAALKDAANYKWADDAFDGTVAWSIAQADADALTMAKTVRYSTTSAQTITVNEIAQLLNAPGDVTIGACVFVDADGVLAVQEGTADAITYALVDGLTEADANKTVTIITTISSDNYNDVELVITVTVQDKIDVSDGITFADGEAAYTGKVQQHETATYNGSVEGITYNYSADPVNVGVYQVTAIYEDADHYGTKTVSFRINPVAVRVTGAKVETKKYDGNEDATIETVTFAGLVNGETLSTADYTVTAAAFENANAGTGKQVTYNVALNDTVAASNYVLTGTAPAATGKIEPKEITVSLGSIAAQAFTGKALEPAVTVTATGTVDGYELIMGTDYTVSYENNVNAGTAAKAVVTAKNGSNYTFAQAKTAFEITKAAAPVLSNLSVEYTYNYAGTGTVTIEGIPADAGDVTYEVGAADGEVITDITAANGKLSITLQALDVSKVGANVTIPVTVKMQNYGNADFEITVTRCEKERPIVAVQSVEKTYDGEELTANDIIGVATFEGAELTGTWAWVTDPATMVNANEAGYTATVKFIPDDSETYMEVDAVVTVVINKADPVGRPGYTKITEQGKTLADAMLNIGTLTPAGTIAWVLPVTTEAKQGVAYQWIFTPADTTNYNSISGTIKPYDNSNAGLIFVLGGAVGNPIGSSGIISRFHDVSYGDWYADAVTMVVSEGLFEGTSYNYFDPNGTMTRAMLVTVLWRLAGQPVPYEESAFADVPANEWYSLAVAWAECYGIVDGVSETSFAPNQSVTREQMVTILHRYAKSLGYSGTQSADLSQYTDSASVSAYAESAVSWAVAKGLISGMTETTLAPKGTATRAQVATILMRFVNNVL